jgi:hypothetical protein
MRAQLRRGLVVAIVLGCTTTATTSAATSPSDLLASILRSARAQRSVHYVASASLGGARIDQIGDAARAQGIQRITYRKTGTTGHVTVIVSADSAYVRGDAFTLINYMGFKAVPAATYANRWILVPRGDRDYATVALGVRLASTIDELKLPAPISRVPDTTVAGQHVVGVRAKVTPSPGVTATVTLYGRATGSPLPVQEVTTQPGTRFTVTLGKWNEPVRITAPAGAVPISQTGLE